MSYPLPSIQSPGPVKEEWHYKAIPHLVSGIHTGKRSDLLDDSQCSTLLNVYAKQGRLLSDTGYIKFASTVKGIPQLEYRFLRADTTTDIMLVTTRSLYEYNEALRYWRLVKGTAGTTLSAAFGAGVLAVTVASAAGFATGDLIGIDLESGGQHQTTITVSGTTFTLADAMPSAAASGAVVIVGPNLSGDLDHQVSATVVAGNDWFVFTNGIDIVKRYNGTDCVDVPNLPASGITVCAAVAYYNAALFLLNTIEGATRFPQRVRRSNQGDPTDWTTGTAGKDDLLDRPDHIKCAHVLGPYLIVYRSESISRGQFVGASGLNYDFPTVVSGEGAISTGAVAVMEDHHIVVGNQNVYIYRGDFSLSAIGDAVFHRMYSTKGNLHPANKHKTFAFYITELDEFWVMYPSVDAVDGCDKLLRYSISNKAWYERQFADQFVGFGFFQVLDVFSWDDLVGSWDDQQWAWDSQVELKESFNIHLLHATLGQVYEYDYSATLDNATPIKYTVETKDFLVPDYNLRFDTLEAMIQGHGVQVEYSTNGGRTWDYLGETKEKATINSDTLEKISLCKQFVTGRFRIRFSGSDPNFELQWIALLYKTESLY